MMNEVVSHDPNYQRRWIIENPDIREAFGRTQAGFRAEALYAHPYYWAGFVLI